MTPPLPDAAEREAAWQAWARRHFYLTPTQPVSDYSHEMHLAHIAYQSAWETSRTSTHAAPVDDANANAAAVLNDPHALHLHLLRNPLPRETLLHLLGTDAPVDAGEREKKGMLTPRISNNTALRELIAWVTANQDKADWMTVQLAINAERLLALLAAPAGDVALDREALGRITREAWVEYTVSGGWAQWESYTSWELMGDTDKEFYRCIGEAVARAVSGPARSEAMLRRGVEAGIEAAAKVAETHRNTKEILTMHNRYDEFTRLAILSTCDDIRALSVDAIVAQILSETKGEE